LSCFEFESRKFLVVLPHYHVILFRKSCLLVSWCAGDRCGMMGSDENRGRSRRPGAEDQGWSSTGRVLDGWMVKRSGYAMCGLHRTQGDEEHGFFG
jgi:hypothetical protein